MRRILTVLTAAALMAAWLVVLQGPAMAQSFDFDNDDNDIFDNNRFFGFDNDDNDIFDRDNGFFGFGGFEQETDETGDVTLDTSIVNTGNNSNQCVAPLQFGNTGSFQNEQGFVSLGSSSDDRFDNDGFFDFFDSDGNVDDVDFEGGTFEFAPEQNVSCNQAVQQSAAASS